MRLSFDAETNFAVRNCRRCHLKSLDDLALLIVFLRRYSSLQSTRRDWDEQQAPQLSHRRCACDGACACATGACAWRWRRRRPRRRRWRRQAAATAAAAECMAAVVACMAAACGGGMRFGGRRSSAAWAAGMHFGGGRFAGARFSHMARRSTAAHRLPSPLPSLCVLWRSLALRRLQQLLAQGVDAIWTAVGQCLQRLRLLLIAAEAHRD